MAQQHNPAMSPYTKLKGPPSHGTKAKLQAAGPRPKEGTGIAVGDA